MAFHWLNPYQERKAVFPLSVELYYQGYQSSQVVLQVKGQVKQVSFCGLVNVSPGLMIHEGYTFINSSMV